MDQSSHAGMEEEEEEEEVEEIEEIGDWDQMLLRINRHHGKFKFEYTTRFLILEGE